MSKIDFNEFLGHLDHKSKLTSFGGEQEDSTDLDTDESADNCTFTPMITNLSRDIWEK